MRAIIAEPGKPARVEDIGNDLETLQTLVGGYIETVRLPLEGAVVIVNEEGKLMGLKENRTLVNLDRSRVETLVGTIVIVGDDGEEFGNLTEIQASRLKRKFDWPTVLVG